MKEFNNLKDSPYPLREGDSKGGGTEGDSKDFKNLKNLKPLKAVKAVEDGAGKKSLAERREGFRQQLLDYHDRNPDKYPPQLYEDFFNYWTESNDTKMLFEVRKAKNGGIFNIPGRLATWAKNNKIYNNSPPRPSYKDAQLKQTFQNIDEMFK